MNRDSLKAIIVIFALFGDESTNTSQGKMVGISKSAHEAFETESNRADKKSPENLKIARADSPKPQDYGTLKQEIKKINGTTSSRDHYALFLRLKEFLFQNPDKIADLRDFPLFDEPQTESDKMQLSLIYGALAQCGRPEAWYLLKDALILDSGEFVGFQAVNAITDLGAAVPDEAFESLLAVSRGHEVEYIRNSAVLALGSLSRTQPEFARRFGPMIEARLITQDLNTPWDLIDVTLAAAGNHGDPRYSNLIKKFYDHPDDTIRARVLFALRQIPTLEVVNWIALKARKDSSPKVQIEGLKALSEMDKSQVEFPDVGPAVDSAMGEIAINGRSQEVVSTGIRFLSHSLINKRPSTLIAFNNILSHTSDPRFKEAIAEHIQKSLIPKNP